MRKPHIKKSSLIINLLFLTSVIFLFPFVNAETYVSNTSDETVKAVQIGKISRPENIRDIINDFDIEEIGFKFKF